MRLENRLRSTPLKSGTWIKFAPNTLVSAAVTLKALQKSLLLLARGLAMMRYLGFINPNAIEPSARHRYSTIHQSIDPSSPR
jgi:hypothetical protein